ncbi:hypothetical protein XELAEV_18036636mg, partial [Xenopus laevis]
GEWDPRENSEQDSGEQLPLKNEKPKRTNPTFNISIYGPSLQRNTFRKITVKMSTEELKKYFDVGKCLHVREWKPPEDTSFHLKKGDLIFCINGFRLESRKMLFYLLNCCTEKEVMLTLIRVEPHFHTMGCSCTSPGANDEALN